MSKNLTQQEFLYQAMSTLGLNPETFAARLGTNKKQVDAWLLPADDKDFRNMDDLVWNFVREILNNSKDSK